MSRNRKTLVLWTAMGATIILLAQVALAQSTVARSKSAASMAPANTRPLNGKVVAIDKEERTMIVGPLAGAIPTLSSNQVVMVSTNTVFLKNRARTTFNEVAVGNEVRFRLRKNPDGKDVLNFLVIGTPQAPIRPGTTARPGIGTTPAN